MEQIGSQPAVGQTTGTKPEDCSKIDAMKAKERRRKPPENCPVCGEDVPPRALACPECGADHNSGWRDDANSYDGLGAEEDEFDYEKFVRDEFGSSPKPTRISTMWWITAILILLALTVLYFYGLA